MQGVRRRVGGIFGAAITVVISLLFASTALAVFVFHFSVHPVLSGSMRPTFDPGWAIITKPIPVSEIRRGDILLFKPPGEAAQYAHRVVTISGSSAHPVITTKGDANRSPDLWHARLTGSTVPEVVGEVPEVGSVMVDIRDQWTHVVLVALLGLGLCLVGTRAILGGSGAGSAHRTRRSHAHAAPD